MTRPDMRSSSSMRSPFSIVLQRTVSNFFLDFCAHDAQVSSGLRLIQTSASNEQEESHRREKEVGPTVLAPRPLYLPVVSIPDLSFFLSLSLYLSLSPSSQESPRDYHCSNLFASTFFSNIYCKFTQSKLGLPPLGPCGRNSTIKNATPGLVKVWMGMLVMRVTCLRIWHTQFSEYQTLANRSLVCVYIR